MSLLDLGVLPPLPDRCAACGRGIGKGTRIAVNELKDIVCATCFLKDKLVETPKGPLRVDYIKMGDGSPFPVVCCTCLQFTDAEVGNHNPKGSKPNE